MGEIQAALFIPSMEYHDSMEMLTWLRDDARGRVGCDIYINDIHSYLPSFYGHQRECKSSVAHYLFFTDLRDAMMVKLRWMGQRMEDHHWCHIHAGGEPLACRANGEILVDSSVQHVR